MRRRRRQHGATLLEIMISLALVLVGMLALFKVLTSSISGSATSSRMSQAQVRLMAILESMRHAPEDLTTGAIPPLDCLVNAGHPDDSIPTDWRACETSCLTLLGGAAQHDACIYSMDSFKYVPGPSQTGAATFNPNGQQSDRAMQQYFIDPRSQVKRSGVNNFVYDIDLWVGWWDDNKNTVPTLAQVTAGPVPGYHVAHFRTGVFP